MFLLFTDSHWDDAPNNEYRWQIFQHVRKIAKEKKISHIFHLGDAVDKKDRFPSSFVNRLVSEFHETIKIAPLTILRGNHDSPLNGPAFFEFLNYMAGTIEYITEPTLWSHDLALLPYSADPIEDWKGINFQQLKAAFMHQTPSSAISENGTALNGHRLPIFPRDLNVYTGDAHVQQKIRNIVCIGCPHHIKFGDKFPCRILLLDEDTFDIAKEIKLETQSKRVIEVSSLAEIEQLVITSGDQVRIKFNLATDQIENWGAIEQKVVAWAKQSGVDLASVEAIIEQKGVALSDLDTSPETILREFAEDEKISEELLSVGLELLKE
jgi:predicted phosphodiesterase